VGVLLYNALTGVTPFERESPHETLLALLGEEAPSPRTFVPEIPEHLEMVVQKAMAKNAEDRYQWIAHLNQALAPYDPSHATAAPPTATGAAPNVVAVAPMPSAEASEAGGARGWIVMSLLFGIPVVLAALWLAVGGVLRTAGVDVGTTAWTIILVTLVCALSTPIFLLLRHVSRMWGNTVRAVGLARALRAPLLTAAVVYALGTLSLRVAYTAVMALPRGIIWPAWDSLLLLVAGLAGLIAFLRVRKA
jgi:serine/threonine-protein kinase